MKKKDTDKSKSKVGTNKSNNTYAASLFSIELPQTNPQTSGQQYSRDFLPDTKQYSTSGRIEKSLTYVIKRK